MDADHNEDSLEETPFPDWDADDTGEILAPQSESSSGPVLAQDDPESDPSEDREAPVLDEEWGEAEPAESTVGIESPFDTGPEVETGDLFGAARGITTQPGAEPAGSAGNEAPHPHHDSASQSAAGSEVVTVWPTETGQLPAEPPLAQAHVAGVADVTPLPFPKPTPGIDETMTAPGYETSKPPDPAPAREVSDTDSTAGHRRPGDATTGNLPDMAPLPPLMGRERKSLRPAWLPAGILPREGEIQAWRAPANRPPQGRERTSRGGVSDSVTVRAPRLVLAFSALAAAGLGIQVLASSFARPFPFDFGSGRMKLTAMAEDSDRGAWEFSRSVALDSNFYGHPRIVDLADGKPTIDPFGVRGAASEPIKSPPIAFWSAETGERSLACPDARGIHFHPDARGEARIDLDDLDAADLRIVHVPFGPESAGDILFLSDGGRFSPVRQGVGTPDWKDWPADSRVAALQPIRFDRESGTVMALLEGRGRTRILCIDPVGEVQAEAEFTGTSPLARQASFGADGVGWYVTDLFDNSRLQVLAVILDRGESGELVISKSNIRPEPRVGRSPVLSVVFPDPAGTDRAADALFCIVEDSGAPSGQSGLVIRYTEGDLKISDPMRFSGRKYLDSGVALDFDRDQAWDILMMDEDCKLALLNGADMKVSGIPERGDVRFEAEGIGTAYSVRWSISAPGEGGGSGYRLTAHILAGSARQGEGDRLLRRVWEIEGPRSSLEAMLRYHRWHTGASPMFGEDRP